MTSGSGTAALARFSRHGLAGDGHARRVEQACLRQALHHGRDAAGGVQVLDVVAAAAGSG